ncbi:metallophosphoesterase [Lactiplantibacillus plantarum]|uniref:metallophosphoesterase n=1 Tax=Lactiplantibacillus plantarum TaxID=1590 RepID=UPI000CDDA81D|nr:metallophosphoesterase [Lactiplantibacillus plantarum]KAF1284794.1 phosphoesterase [Lactiplantibacillus plantarum]MDY8146312.1 metallophosphoesterase [Lactiplantibacillus plantarum]RAH96492.1 phosphoesterase [Lactiplantibacillus plantarum]
MEGLTIVRIAFSSDNHFDVNRVDATAMMRSQATYLLQNGVQIYLIAGDLFNDFQRSQQFVVDLQALLGAQTRVYWIAGNHDMVHGISFDELETGYFDGYLHNRYIDISGTDWRVIGHNGWYDYQYAAQVPDTTAADFLHWKNAFWIDRAIKQPMSDQERTDLMLNQVKAQLNLAAVDHKQVIFMTHFVPRIDYLRFSDDNRFWNMANALMGTPRLGQLLEQFNVAHVLFGHLHVHPQPRVFGQTTYYDQAVGYGLKRINEWQANNFMAEWYQDTQILDLK